MTHLHHAAGKLCSTWDGVGKWELEPWQLGGVCGRAKHQQCVFGQFHMYSEGVGVG